MNISSTQWWTHCPLSELCYRMRPKPISDLCIQMHPGPMSTQDAPKANIYAGCTQSQSWFWVWGVTRYTRSSLSGLEHLGWWIIWYLHLSLWIKSVWVGSLCLVDDRIDVHVSIASECVISACNSVTCSTVICDRNFFWLLYSVHQ